MPSLAFNRAEVRLNGNDTMFNVSANHFLFFTEVSSRQAVASSSADLTGLPTAGPSAQASSSAQPPAASRKGAEDSEMESDDDSHSMENAWRGDGDSDAESVDSELENPLK